MLAENERTRRLEEMRENRAVRVVQVREKNRERGYGSDDSVVDSIVAA